MRLNVNNAVAANLLDPPRAHLLPRALNLSASIAVFCP
jgi:hypothetical protein